MVDWQEIIALSIVALAAFGLVFPTIRRWMGAEKTISGCGGCSSCGSQRSVPKAAPSSTNEPLLELQIKPLHKGRSTK